MAEQSDAFTQTRLSLHALAELVVAGPRFRQSGELRLRVRPEGIGTWDEPVLALEAGDLVTPTTRFAVDGLTIAQVAERAGLEASALDDVYDDGPHIPVSATVHLDPAALRVIETAFHLGDDALRGLAPDAEPTLWPEHFDVATTIDEVNFGVSPGDGYLDRPYAYVGPHHAVTGDFWNAPFGAARRVEELGGVDAIVQFFSEGARLAHSARA